MIRSANLGLKSEEEEEEEEVLREEEEVMEEEGGHLCNTADRAVAKPPRMRMMMMSVREGKTSLQISPRGVLRR